MLLTVIGYIIYHVYRSKKRKEHKRNTLALRFFNSIEIERKQLANYLHDSIGQDLLIIKNRVLLGLQSKRKKEMIEQFNEISETVTHALEKTRELSYTLYPYQIDRLGLTKALESLINRSFYGTSIKINRTITVDEKKIPYNYSIQIYRILQETIQNILRHARATEVSVTVDISGNVLFIVITDNGVGICSNISPSEIQNGGLGIPILQERVRVLGGSISISSEQYRGTSIRIEIPLIE
ncbi:MAG: ATP-binding protein [Bacteroidetes bacterium]|nr:ATP-binding protein [Bacteroidota bacterium]